MPDGTPRHVIQGRTDERLLTGLKHPHIQAALEDGHTLLIDKGIFPHGLHGSLMYVAIQDKRGVSSGGISIQPDLRNALSEVNEAARVISQGGRAPIFSTDYDAYPSGDPLEKFVGLGGQVKVIVDKQTGRTIANFRSAAGSVHMGVGGNYEEALSSYSSLLA